MSIQNPSITKPRLRQVSDETPGFSRQKWGRGFIYKDQKGNRIKDEVVIRRIKDLVIPPAWEEVWICPHTTGHLQCTGKDIKQRKQYIYHPKWANYNRKTNFQKLRSFGESLPQIRRQIEKDLKFKDWTKQKVLALVVHLLDEYYLRIGNKHYSDTNETYGLTTLRRKHILATKKSLTLSFLAKSNKRRTIKIGNKKLAGLVREISELPGYEVFRYSEGTNDSRPINSHDVNEYIQFIAGEMFTAKDFRTWGGTKLAVEFYDKAKKSVEENPRVHLEPTLIAMVAEVLGNTVAICRDYYIHPQVLDTLVENKLPTGRRKRKRKFLENSEQTILEIID